MNKKINIYEKPNTVLAVGSLFFSVYFAAYHLKTKHSLLFQYYENDILMDLPVNELNIM